MARKNFTLTLPAEVKARVRAYAEVENNQTSRIVENAILSYLGPWGTEHDTSNDAEKHRRVVAKHLADELAS